MSEVVYERIKKNLEILNMKNTSLILDNYLEKAIHDKKNIVEILDYLLSEEAKTKKNRAVENQIKMSGFPYRKTLEQFDFDFQPSINKEQIMELATMRFVENKEIHLFKYHKHTSFLAPTRLGPLNLCNLTFRPHRQEHLTIFTNAARAIVWANERFLLLVTFRNHSFDLFLRNRPSKIIVFQCSLF